MRGLSESEIAHHYFDRYGKEWGISDASKMLGELVGRRVGVGKLPLTIFEGKANGGISAAFRSWLRANGKKRARIGRAQAWKKRGPLSESHREKIRLAHLNMRPSPETRAKLSASRTGKKLKRSTRRKISKKLRGLKRGPMPGWHRKKLSDALSGKPRSEEVKKRISEGRRKGRAVFGAEINRVRGIRSLRNSSEDAGRADGERRKVPIIAVVDNPASLALDSEARSIIDGEIGKLPRMQSEIIKLVFLRGKNRKSAAGVLGISMREFNLHYEAALAALRKRRTIREVFGMPA
jgi:hypothetical protein